MRLLLLWCMLALAVVARAETEEGLPGSPVIQDEDVDLLQTLDENARIDVARMLADLFEFDDDDDKLHDEEEGISREARVENGEESALEQKAKIEPVDQARYNKFMDTFFKRLNADARSSIDPLAVAIVNKKATKKGGEKKKGPKKGGDSKKKSGNKKKNKKTQKRGNKKKSKNKNKTKKTARHPKHMNLEEADEDEGESANEEVAVAEEDNHHIVTREAEEFEEIEEEDEEEEDGLERQERSADAVVEDEDVNAPEAAVARRKGKPKGDNKKKKKKGGKRNGGKKKKKGKSKTKRSASKKKTTKNKAKSDKKSKRSSPKTSRAAVAGIATLSRVGDVSVVDRKDGKELRTGFKIGPVTLKVNRRFGSGKSATVRSATASSPELTGRMHLSVAANGRAKITKFNIARPSVVTTSGTLSKDRNKRTGNNNFIESSISRIVPTAAKKLKLAAREVLQATESKN